MKLLNDFWTKSRHCLTFSHKLNHLQPDFTRNDTVITCISAHVLPLSASTLVLTLSGDPWYWPCAVSLSLSLSRAMSSAATTSPSVDKVDGFSRKSVRKAKQKRSQSSSQFRSQGKPIELTPLPLLKGKTQEVCVCVLMLNPAPLLDLVGRSVSSLAPRACLNTSVLLRLRPLPPSAWATFALSRRLQQRNTPVCQYVYACVRAPFQTFVHMLLVLLCHHSSFGLAVESTAHSGLTWP